jgi:uridine kinase
MSVPFLELPSSSLAELQEPTTPSLGEQGNDSPRAHYSPPWANTSIIGIAGSSGSGKTSLSMAIIRQLSLPWVVILSMDSFYKPLTPEQSAAAFRNEYDFDAPEAIDFDVLVEKLQDIKSGYARNNCWTIICHC